MATVGLASSVRATGVDGEERAEIVSEISTDEQCAEWKAQFASKYEVYRSLDSELSGNTAKFEQLEATFNAASPDAKSTIAAQMQSLWDQKKEGMQRKLQQYRRLHVDLKEIKNAVNRYVADRNASHQLTTPDGSVGA